MARLYELFAVSFLIIGVVCSRSVHPSESSGDYERTASLSIEPITGLAITGHDKNPGADQSMGDLRISPIAQKILQSSALITKRSEQDPASDSKDREDPERFRKIRSPQESETPKPPVRGKCYLKLCSPSSNSKNT